MSININVFGLNEIKEYINPNRIDKALAQGVNIAVLQIHNALRDSVAERYTFKTSLDSVLVGKSIDNAKQGKGFIRSGLNYRSVPRDLSKFDPDNYVGNINPDATREGRVHTVEIVKGRRKVSLGKRHNGGFMPRYGSLKKPGKLKLYPPHGARMLERLGASRTPVKMLFGPTLASAAKGRFEQDPKVQRVVDRIELTILEQFIP